MAEARHEVGNAARAQGGVAVKKLKALTHPQVKLLKAIGTGTSESHAALAKLAGLSQPATSRALGQFLDDRLVCFHFRDGVRHSLSARGHRLLKVHEAFYAALAEVV